MINVKAGGGAVLREKDGEKQVLLVFRRGVWDLPKGKQEKGETIEVCACREVAEETGIKNPAIKEFLVKTYHNYKRNGKLYKKETVWFAMEAEDETLLKPQKEEGIIEVAWVEVGKAKERVGYKNLNEVLQHL